MTDMEVMGELLRDTPWNKARQHFRFQSVKIDRVSNPIEQRRLEFEAVKKIAEILNGK